MGDSHDGGKKCQVLDISKGHATGFADGLGEGYDPEAEIKNRAKVLSPETEKMRLLSSEKEPVCLFLLLFFLLYLLHTLSSHS